MKIIHSDEPSIKLPLTKSIFLAGPTPRDNQTLSWRSEAIDIFKNFHFDGTIFVPERKIREKDYDYNQQVEWEWDCLHASDVILFWVPREKSMMPGFTTNVEFGFYLSEGNSLVLYGRPEWAEKKGYLDWLYKKVTNRTPYDNLTDMIKYVVNIFDN